MLSISGIRSLRCVVFSFCAVFVGAGVAGAQVDRGGIVGIVTDESSAVVPGVSVSITNIETGQVTTLITDTAGRYTATLLRVGTYTVVAEQPGFSKTVQNNVVLSVGQVANVNLTMKVGGVDEQVQVVEAPPLIDEESSSVGTIETEARIVALPLNGRNFVQLAYLSAGANDGQAGGNLRQGTVENPRPQQRLSVNGLRTANNNWLLDGVDNNQLSNGGLIIMPPPDAIQEFRIEENSMSAEFGRGGSAINVILRSGTNTLHGGAYGFLRNSALDARNFFDTVKSPLRQNQDGFSLGGPIKQNRIFAFGDFQTTHIRRGTTYRSTVPTAKMQAGDFSELGIQLFDPLTTNPITGDRSLLDPANPSVIPQSRIDPVGQKILNYYPLPNLPGLSANYLLNVVRPLNENSFDIRMDAALTRKDQLFTHYSFDSVFVFQPAELGPKGGSANNHAGPISNRYQHWALGWNHTFGGFVNDLHGGFFRPTVVGLPQGAGLNQSQQFGISNSNRDNNSSHLVGIHPSNYQGLGGTEFSPERIAENLYQFADTVSLIRGRHSLKFGGDFRRQQLNFFQLQAAQGEMSFSGQYSSNLSTGRGGNALADILLGLPNSKYQDTARGTWPSRLWDFAVFIQDDVRVTDKLTMNLGLRYSIQSPPNGRIGNFDLTTLKVVDAWGPNPVDHAGIKFDKKDFGPRVGLAWSPFGQRTVVRAAFGMFYATDGSSFDDLGLNPPNLGIYTVTYSPKSLPSSDQFLSAGFPAVIPFADPNVPSGNVRATGSTRLVPYVMESNLNVQHQFGQTWMVQAGYVGTRGLRFWNHQTGDLNQPILPLDTNFQNGTNFGRRFYNQLPNLQSIFPLDMSMFALTYHSLQMLINKRLSNGLNIRGSYTFAKNLGTADGLVAGNIQNIYNVGAEKGPVQPDIRHRIAASYVYELPFGKGRPFLSNAPGVIDSVLGGWQLSGITIAQSGSAYVPNLGSDLTNTGSSSPRPDLIHDPYDFSFDVPGQKALGCPGNGQSLLCWFNPAAFALPALAPGQKVARQFGNAGRGTLRGPDLVDFDMGVMKDFRLTERQKLQFRGEFFNIANHPNFSTSGTRVNANGGQRISSTIPENQREIQFALKWSF
jgi:hypothetical protein